MTDYIKSDLIRYYGKTNFLIFLKVYLKNSTVRFQVAFWLCQGKEIVKLIGLILYKINCNRNLTFHI